MEPIETAQEQDSSLSSSLSSKIESSSNSDSDDSETIDNFADDEDSDCSPELNKERFNPPKNNNTNSQQLQILGGFSQLTSSCHMSLNIGSVDGTPNSEWPCALLVTGVKDEKSMHALFESALRELAKNDQWMKQLKKYMKKKTRHPTPSPLKAIAPPPDTVSVNSPNNIVEEPKANETTEQPTEILQENMEPQPSGSENITKHCDTCACTAQSDVTHAIVNACSQHREEIYSEIGLYTFPNLADELNYILEKIHIYEQDNNGWQCVRCLGSNNELSAQSPLQSRSQPPLPSRSMSPVKDKNSLTVILPTEPSNPSVAVASPTAENQVLREQHVFDTSIDQMLQQNLAESRIYINKKFKNSTKFTLQSSELKENYKKSKGYLIIKKKAPIKSEVSTQQCPQNSSSASGIRYEEIQDTGNELPSPPQLQMKQKSNQVRVYTNKKMSSTQSEDQTPDKPKQDNQSQQQPEQKEPSEDALPQPQAADDAVISKKKVIFECSSRVVIPPELPTTDTNAPSRKVMILNSKDGTATMLKSPLAPKKEIAALSAQPEPEEINEQLPQNLQPKTRLSKKALKQLKKQQSAKARAEALKATKELQLVQKIKNEELNKPGASNERARATNTEANATEEGKISNRNRKKGKFFKRLAKKANKY